LIVLVVAVVHVARVVVVAAAAAAAVVVVVVVVAAVVGFGIAEVVAEQSSVHLWVVVKLVQMWYWPTFEVVAMLQLA
jgi:hypothetical protein